MLIGGGGLTLKVRMQTGGHPESVSLHAGGSKFLKILRTYYLNGPVSNDSVATPS